MASVQDSPSQGRTLHSVADCELPTKSRNAHPAASTKLFFHLSHVPTPIETSVRKSLSVMTEVSCSYISIGGNRNPAAADWSSSGLLAFGAGRCISLWDPLVSAKSCFPLIS